MESVLTYEYEQIEAFMRSFLWPFVRISSMFMSMVVIGSAIVSAQKRVVAAFVVCLVVVPVLPPVPAVDLASYNGIMITLQQVFIGITIGFVTRLIFETFIIGGQIVAMSSGLGFAQINDPSSGVVVPAVGQFFLMVATLVFLASDGHLLMIDTIVQSFYTLPIGVSGLSMSALWGIFDMAGGMFEVGLKMSIAAVVSILMVNLSFGILTKVAPTLNIFVIGFPIILTFGLLILWFTMNGFNEYFELRMLQGKELNCVLLNLECPNG